MAWTRTRLIESGTEYVRADVVPLLPYGAPAPLPCCHNTVYIEAPGTGSHFTTVGVPFTQEVITNAWTVPAFALAVPGERASQAAEAGCAASRHNTAVATTTRLMLRSRSRS
ncbi:hypothetical protein [Lentzea kentuckyensis]|uniref:hypothetical protein n=1 Tax=Lentzea kentuckyensis TaxID=360086 RepID=UPI00117B66AE|nr:hypothetical protein [Lentzea kentuckyensis]